ncbi:unnamed protein product [Clavelina lepadiformis]|uniref:Cyclin-L1 n=1 Tax=Clavelina lepadiformis TaxID=159417 RepID=A0ABP0GYZ4_CLALP
MKETVDQLKPEYAGVKLTLENCLIPPDQIAETPSQKDGLPSNVEEDLRFLGCEYIQIAGIMLKMPQMEDVAMASIWLASKVEESPRRVRDVMNVFHFLRQKRQGVSSPTPMPLDEDYIISKNNVIKSERRLLKELGFCVHVKHPHKIIVVYLQVLEMEKNQKLVQTAWNYMNDSLRTSVFVKHTPETIACACIYLAARVLRIPLPNQPHWFYLFNATEDEIQKISLEILHVYQKKKANHDSLEKQVEIRRKILHDEKMKAREANQVENVNSAANSPSGANPSPFAETVSPRDVERTKESSVPKSQKPQERDEDRGPAISPAKVSRHRDHSQKYRATSEGQVMKHRDRHRDRSRDSPPAKHRHRDRSHDPKSRKHRDRDRKREKHSRKRH